MSLQEWLQAHDITVQNQKLIEQAFIHRSYVHEHPDEFEEDNQRLEFIGDAVLQLWTAHYLYHFEPKMNEGQMTKLRAAMVSEPALAKIAMDLDLNLFIKLGVGEQRDQGQIRSSTVADMFEAFIGALYLDGGMTQVHPLLSQVFSDPNLFANDQKMIDYKTQLQEYIQADRARTISYVLLQTMGPPNQRIFEVAVIVDEITYGKGRGSSKKRAEQAAAQEALNKLVK
jgi:ribonuclease III